MSFLANFSRFTESFLSLSRSQYGAFTSISFISTRDNYNIAIEVLVRVDTQEGNN
ncbi:MAG: hypothetical protein ACTSYA_07125 [Candidatus Kariarchaeaceae archaeon]